MPIPIALVGRQPEDKNKKEESIDISFLAQNIPAKEASSFSVYLSDKDADDVMKIWLHAKKTSKDTFCIKDSGIENKDLIRLKSRGLITGGVSEIKFTSKGKTVVKTMTLGESNKFLENKKEKSYTEILASLNKRGKKGFRTAHVYSPYSNILCLSEGDRLGREKSLSELMEKLSIDFKNGIINRSREGMKEIFPGLHNFSFDVDDKKFGKFWIDVWASTNQDTIYVGKSYEDENSDQIKGYDKEFSLSESPYDEIKAAINEMIQ